VIVGQDKANNGTFLYRTHFPFYFDAFVHHAVPYSSFFRSPG
jgi:hypothetical protein